MSETKNEGKFSEGKDSDEELVNVTGIDISPNKCGLSDPLTLDVKFLLTKDVREGYWDIKVRLEHTFV
jgi:hypothetical protein